MELDANGTPVNTYGYGANGLVQRYIHNIDSYLGYVFDPNGNLLHRIRKSDPNTSQGVGVFVADTLLYDGFGQLRCDVDTLDGRLYRNADAVGYHGQQGLYTDVETLDFASGAYLALMGGNGLYYDPMTGQLMVRGAGSGTNDYAFDLNPFSNYSFSQYARDVGGVFAGYGDAAEAMVTPLLHPISTAKGIAQVVHQKGAVGAAQAIGSAVYHDYTDFLSTEDPRRFGQSFGNVLVLAATEGAGAAEGGAEEAAGATSKAAASGGKEVETFERYGSEAEAIASRDAGGLVPRPGHEAQPKWIAEVGKVNPRTLGKRPKVTHSHKIEIEAQPGTREFLKPFEIKENEPGRYAIPADRLEEFNSRIKNIKIRKR